MWIAVAYAPMNHACTSAGHCVRTPDGPVNVVGRALPDGCRRYADCEVLGELGREYRAKYRNADAATDSPEERGSAGGRAEVAILHCVLHSEDQHLHHHAEPDTEHEHVKA